MKKVHLSTILLLGVWALLVFYSCVNYSEKELVALVESEYKGPKSSSEFEVLLNESTNSVIKELSNERKEFLIKYAIFHNNRLRGFEYPDDNIKSVINTNMAELLSVVLQRIVVDIKQLESLSVGSEAGGISYLSFCSNCMYRKTTGCCVSGVSGVCVDYPANCN